MFAGKIHDGEEGGSYDSRHIQTFIDVVVVERRTCRRKYGRTKRRAVYYTRLHRIKSGRNSDSKSKGILNLKVWIKKNIEYKILNKKQLHLKS